MFFQAPTLKSVSNKLEKCQPKSLKITRINCLIFDLSGNYAETMKFTQKTPRKEKNMNQNNQCVYNNFYKTTVGRFYTPEQRLRLLRLFALASGVKENSVAYNAIFRRVDVLEKQNITNYTESKNYSMVSSIFLDDAEMHSALNALVSAHKCISESSDDSLYDNNVNWIITLRRSPPENTALRMELALFEYACENVDVTINELKQLVNRGVLFAIELLACIHEDNKELEEAFYYYSLIKKVYTQELKMAPPLATNERIDVFRDGISVQKAEKITRDIELSPCFFEHGTANGKAIGFVSAEIRKFTYEH